MPSGACREMGPLRPYAGDDERTDALGDLLHRYNSGDSGYVFTAELGRPLRPQRVGDQFSCSPARQGSRLRHVEFDRTPGYALTAVREARIVMRELP